MITGANGHLGSRLANRLIEENIRVRAVVRSETAKIALLKKQPLLEVHVVDYRDESTLSTVAKDCDAIVHLVGILKESENSRYEDAHENATRALVAASTHAGINKIIYLSILGSHPQAHNACLASKGRAEEILLNGVDNSTVIRVPMVLGENDYASLALKKSAAQKLSLTFRAQSLEQPIYAGDVINAIYNTLIKANKGVFDLAGAESISRKTLIKRAAKKLGNTPMVISVPIALAKILAWALEQALKSPPITRTMLGVLDHDDNIDPHQTCAALGIQLTSLDETLNKVLGV